ncbi:hypothetical protein TSUD_372360 [Trifolium subterraneum]|uniref:Mei2-like C-terminal RNA recognition motif domain-containing protein n=1 Tax=Trifolium subterraneum TaxID=3900 RepID=A0A2Z6NAP1_TRISU|nr:hypothetical protein TSUD_372360 [Trifolium subterraneum]
MVSLSPNEHHLPHSELTPSPSQTLSRSPFQQSTRRLPLTRNQVRNGEIRPPLSRYGEVPTELRYIALPFLQLLSEKSRTVEDATDRTKPWKAFNGKKWEKFNSEKVASLAYARIQGKAALVMHFQNSSLMNEDKRCRSVLFHSEGQDTSDQLKVKAALVKMHFLLIH